MPAKAKQYAFNRTRQTFLAHEVTTADTHWSRLQGLIGTKAQEFRSGKALWIIPSHGVHTMFMSFPIDVMYLDANNKVVHLEENVRPWRITPVDMETATVLELPAHTIWNTRTAVGDEVEIDIVKSVVAPVSEAPARAEEAI
jgi:uncharacterized protein